MILANRSKYFKALFFGNFKEKDQDRIDIVGADPLAFERMLDIIYDLKFKDNSFFKCGEKTENTSKVFWEEVGCLLEVADRFDVPRLKRRIKRNLLYYWCTEKNEVDACSFCVNRYAFCLMSGLDSPENLNFHSRTIRMWAEKHFEGVPETIGSRVMKSVLLKLSPK